VITKLVVDCEPKDRKFLKAKKSLGNIVREVSPVGTGNKVALIIWTDDLKEQQSAIEKLRHTIQYFSG
jgi:hypothetical protein